MTALKDCPFCNDPQTNPLYCTSLDRWGFVVCVACSARCSDVRLDGELGSERGTRWRIEAAESWNARPIEDELRAEVERLRTIIRVNGIPGGRMLKVNGQWRNDPAEIEALLDPTKEPTT